MVLSAELLRYFARVTGFVKVFVSEANGESFYRLRTGARHESNYRGGVSTTAEHRSQRNISDQPDPDRLSQTPLHLFQALFLARGIMSRILRQVPVLANTQLPTLEFQQMPWRQFANTD